MFPHNFTIFVLGKRTETGCKYFLKIYVFNVSQFLGNCKSIFLNNQFKGVPYDSE